MNSSNRIIILITLIFVIFASANYSKAINYTEIDDDYDYRSSWLNSNDENESEALVLNTTREEKIKETSPASKIKAKKENPSDSMFYIKFSLLIVSIIGLFVLLQMLLNNLFQGKSYNLLNGITQIFTKDFSTHEDIRLKQKLPLAPGQNLYLLEVSGKEILVGGTPQGGVHFIADLSKDKGEIFEGEKKTGMEKELANLIKNQPEEVIVKSSILENKIKHLVFDSSKQLEQDKTLEQTEEVNATKADFSRDLISDLNNLFDKNLAADVLEDNPFMDLNTPNNSTNGKNLQKTIKKLEAKANSANKALQRRNELFKPLKRRTSFKKSLASSRVKS